MTVGERWHATHQIALTRFRNDALSVIGLTDAVALGSAGGDVNAIKRELLARMTSIEANVISLRLAIEALPTK